VTRRVRWTRAALDDIKAQASFIARDDRAAALQVADRLRGTAAALADRPTGRPGRVAGTYEKSVARLPYVIAYALSDKAGDEAVVILRVIHTARDWPAGEWPE
jgi:plasmid stabilization system protein ParE